MPIELSDEELEFLRGVLDLARQGRTPELAHVLERGVPANLTGASGDTLLILAAYHDHPTSVRMLLEHGADPNRVNDRGQTALGAAVFRRSVESVELLLGHGADPNAGARSAVEIADFFGLDEMSALLAAGNHPLMHDELLRIEHELGAGSADAYRRHLAETALIVLPSGALDRDECIAAMETSPRWDELEITDARTLPLGDDAAVLTYAWRSRRGDTSYSALMSSVYVRRAGEWLLVLHQQTPR
jgi:hypothetical protein